ncbi:MAG: hypothetical protein P8049_09840, partial [Gemmatimonadota bacterium]
MSAACDTDNPPLLGSGGGASGGGSQDSLISVFEILSGNLQTGSTLEVFRFPLRVIAADRQGFAVPGVRVRWEIRRGVGTLSLTSDSTGPLGVSEALLTAGSVLGPIEVNAYVDA